MRDIKNTSTTLPRLISLLCFIALISISSNLYAQGRKLKKGIDHYHYQEFAAAIPWLKKALDENDKSYTAVKLLANSYRKIRDYSNAELYYLLVVNSDSVKAEDHLYFGQVLKANGKLAAAKEQFLKFSEKAENSFLGNIMLQSIDEINSWEEVPKEYESQASSKLNTAFSEFGLWMFKNQVYITSNRTENYYSPESSSWSDEPFLSIYEADSAILNKEEKHNFKIAKGWINTQYHDGPLTINPQEDRIVISRISNHMKGKDFVNRMKLFEGEYEGGKWKNFKPFPYNSDEYSVGHAVFADSGKTLYFSSNMPGGYGEMDLYVTHREGESWSKPKNLGSAINTLKNEVFPYVKDSTLYFSSDGFVGYGGLDIFYSTKTNNSWQAPENLKRPINSNRDDFSIYFVTDSTGFYASNREGGKGKDDIYDFVRTPPQIEVDFHALFEYEGLAVEGVKVILLNDQDSTIAIKYSDREGRFKFDNLPYKKNYFIRIETKDGEELDGGRLFLTDGNGSKLKLLTILREKLYSYKALPAEEVRLALESAQDPNSIDRFIFAGKVYKKLPGDTGEMMVYLLSEEGEIIDSVLTDEFGNFSFEKLGEEENYLIALSTEDLELNIGLVTEKGRIYALANMNEEGRYRVDKQLDASTNAEKAKNLGYTTLIAKIEHHGLPIKFTSVKIYDAQNNLVATVLTNENGEFQYNHLEYDDVYFIELPDLDDKTKFESLLYVMNQAGDPLYLINQLKDGRFKFFSLPYDEYEKVQEKEIAYVPNIVKVVGQLYKKLPGDYTEGIKVYVLNEEGDIIDSVVTNSKGLFKFEKLRSDESYSFKVAGGGEDFNLALLDENNVIIDKAILNEKGNFSYKKLTYQVAQFEKLELVEEGLIEDKYVSEIYGQVYKKLPGDFGDSLKVFIYDDEGNFLGTAYTDEEGKFKFTKLKEAENYFFKIEHEEDNFQLLTLDENDNIIEKTIKNRLGQFKYTKLGMTQHEVLLEEASDHQIVYYDHQKIDLTKYTVHYRFDRSSLESAELEKLKQMVKVLNQKELKIEVISHTDLRGAKEYNQELSQERTKNVINYLIKFGLSEDQLIGNYFGELKPIIDCQKYDCDNDDHRLNRRTEFKFLDFDLNELEEK